MPNSGRSIYLSTRPRIYLASNNKPNSHLDNIGDYIT